MNISVNGLPVLSCPLIQVRGWFSDAPGVHLSSKLGQGLHSSHLLRILNSQLGPLRHEGQITGLGTRLGKLRLLNPSGKAVFGCTEPC